MQLSFRVLLLLYGVITSNGNKPRTIFHQIPDIRGRVLDIGARGADILEGVSTRYIPQNYVPQRIELHRPTRTTRSNRLALIFPFAVELSIGTAISSILMDLTPMSIMFAGELSFLVYCAFITERYLSKPKQLEPYEGDRGWTFIWREALRDVSDPREWLKSWFLDENLEFESISYEDVIDFMSWAMFLTRSDQLDHEQREEVESTIRLIESRASWEFPRRMEGRPLDSMRSTIEPMYWLHKPAAFYILTQGLLGGAFREVMRRRGFTEESKSGFSYFIKRSKTAPSSPPVVFFHGVGGLPAYINLIQGFKEEWNIVVLEMPYVSLHVEPNVPTIQEHIDWFSAVLEDNNWQNGTIIGHSWGSNVCSWIVQSIPNKVRGMVLLDPVCLMLHLNSITKGWFYSEENSKPTEDILGSVVGLVKTELFTVSALQRRVVWSRNILFPSEIQAAKIPTAVVVSMLDKIVPSKDIVRQINEHNNDVGDEYLKIYQLEGSEHGGCVFDNTFRETVLEIIKSEIV